MIGFVYLHIGSVKQSVEADNMINMITITIAMDTTTNITAAWVVAVVARRVVVSDGGATVEGGGARGGGGVSLG